MSKTAVPDVYTRVIRDVIEASRQDFEEGGVDLGALELLKQGWQKRLTNEQIASFPWEPKSEPVKQEQVKQSPSNGLNAQASIQLPHIKQEQYAQREAQNYPQQAYPPQQNASARAAEYLQEKFGDRASEQISALNRSGPPNQLPRVPQPQIKQEMKQEIKEEYPQNWVQTSQVDGSSEWQDEFARRKALVSQNRSEGDKLIRNQVAASQQALEGGGLMMPLNQHVTSNAEPSKQSSIQKAQGDAAGDEDDEDAINSDLDDPDELDDNAADGDDVANVMLCTYDKVQRVKNKWKCTLKDGVLKVDGTDYVFHKGQGEFEW